MLKYYYKLDVKKGCVNMKQIKKIIISSMFLCFYIISQPYALAFNQNISAKFQNVEPWVWLVYGIIIGSFVWIFFLKHKSK